MMAELVSGGVLLTWGGPFSYLAWRFAQVRKAERKGIDFHTFDAHIRKDYGSPEVMRWCDVCNQGRKALIHIQSPVPVESRTGRFDPNKLRELERVEIRHRFESDPEWVQVFGHEYDPDTFRPIPQFHNGECGGPHDSCERCSWERDQTNIARTTELRKSKAETDARMSAEKKLTLEEYKGYQEILWAIWNTLHHPGEAYEEFTDIRSDIGMLKNASLRKDILSSDIFKRLDYCLITQKEHPLAWHRREEVWVTEEKRKADRRRYL